jgi:hypothetical protein
VIAHRFVTFAELLGPNMPGSHCGSDGRVHP